MRGYVNKPTKTINRRDFLRLSSLSVGGLAVSPLVHILEQQAIGLEGLLTKSSQIGMGREPAPLLPNPLLKELGFNNTDRVAIIEQ